MAPSPTAARSRPLRLSGALIIDDTTFANSGTLAISNGDEVVIEATLSNTGSITLAGGASLVLDTTFTLAGLGNVTNSGGAIYVEGTLDNAGSTLNVDRASPNWSHFPKPGERESGVQNQ